jgi:hypothetical protein
MRSRRPAVRVQRRHPPGRRIDRKTAILASGLRRVRPGGWRQPYPHWLTALWQRRQGVELGLVQSDVGRGGVGGNVPFLDLHAGQQPAMQRAERHDGQSELLRGWGELVFGGAVDEVVLDLGADRRGGQVAVVGDPQRLGDLPGRWLDRAT